MDTSCGLLLPLLSMLLPIYCDPVEPNYPDCDQNVCIINKPEFVLTGLIKRPINLTLTLSSPHHERPIPVRMKCVPDGGFIAKTSCEEFVARRFYDVHLTRINLALLPIFRNHTVELHTAINSELDSVLSDPLPLTLIVVDSRKLRIGFSEDSLELQGGSLSINIRNFDAPYSLEKDVILTVRLGSSQNPNISTAIVNFNSLDVNQSVSFADLDPLQNYKAILSLADTEMEKQVTLTRSMADFIPKIYFVESKKTLYNTLSDLYGKISDLYNKMMALHSAIENIDGCKDSFQCANQMENATTTTTTTTTTTATATATTEATDTGDTEKENASTGTQVTPIETESTSSTTGVKTGTTSTSGTGTERTTETDYKTNTGNVDDPVPSTITDNTSANDVDDTEPSIVDGGNGFFWGIFAGFVAGFVACSGCALAILYLVFNHREKVKVYAVGWWWKGSNAAKSTSSKSHEYTALPTSS